jgi:hypothetical protein
MIDYSDLFVDCDADNDICALVGTRYAARALYRLLIMIRDSPSQPAIDAFTLSLQRQFNKLPSDGRSSATNDLNGVQPLVFGTYQAYLRRYVVSFTTPLLIAFN